MTTTATAGSTESLLTEQAKADLQWIAAQRESILREVDRQQSELGRKKEELDKLSREVAEGILSGSRQAMATGSGQRLAGQGAITSEDWIQKMLNEIKHIKLGSSDQTSQEERSLGQSSTPKLSNLVNPQTSQPSAGTFTVLNRPPVLSTGYTDYSDTASNIPRTSAPSQGQSHQLLQDWSQQNWSPQDWSQQEQRARQPPQSGSQSHQGGPQQGGPKTSQGGSQVPQGGQQPPQGGSQLPRGGLQSQQGQPQLPQGLPQSQAPQSWPQQQPPQGWPQPQPPQGWPEPQPPQGWPQPQPPLGWPQTQPPQIWPQPQPQQGWPQPQPQQGWPQQGWSENRSPQQGQVPQSGPQQGNPAPNPPTGPTPQQLLARQIMPKELPKFYGNPEDWPLFLAAFTNSTDACGYTNVENMARLQHAIQGRALEQVKGRLLYPTLVPQVMSTLYMLYGRPELIIQTLLDKVRECPPPKAEKLETLITFAMAVQNLCDHIIAAGQVAHLCNPVLLRELVDKLPAQQRLNWALFKQQFPVIDLSTFAAYMMRLAEAASEVTVITDSKQTRRAERGGERSYMNVHSTSDSPTRDEPQKEETSKKEVGEIRCLACNSTNHKVKNCGKFQKWELNLRWKLVQDNHLCRTCLGKHGRRPCNLRTRCGVDGCQERHHELLHREAPKDQTSSQEGQNQAGETKTAGDGFNAHHATKKSTLFRILPVTLTWNGRSVNTFAFLDDGSDLTLVEQSIAEHLGIDDGVPTPLCLSWTSNVTRQEPKSQRIRLEISGEGKKERFTLNDTRTVASLDLPKQTMQFSDLARKFTYLRGLPVRSYEAATPGILIGSNNAGLIATLNLREGELGDPLASKTRLGWTIYGSSSDGQRTANFTLHVCNCREDQHADQELHDLVKRHFTVESIGVSADKGPESEEDKRARRILEETTKRVGDRFETGLLWRHDETRFPDSFPMAMRRLECFERRMKRDPELQASVQRQIKEYLERSYIHEVTPEEIESANPHKVWHLPLGAVRNPKKPGKIRLIWDASAKVGNVSLNAMLLKGPDLLTPLASVLCGFRERPVAVCGDLRQMFHQFRIRSEDVHSQRFLYREHFTEPVKVFAMDVGSFGATCSPCQAQYIKNRNAREHEKEFPEAAKAVINKHYVDDYLDSFDTEAEAIKVALDVKELHSRGGFEIRNWHSNSEALLTRVGEPKHVSTKAISIDSESEAERVLGLLWLPEEDLLAFATELQLDGIPPTKRNILRCVMSLFDSQGLLSHITIQGRMIIQDTWRSKAKWDDEVIATIRARWIRWTQLFKKVGEIRLNRAYFPGFSAAEIGAVELHVFTDASEEAYACTAYFRVVINGKVYVTLAMAKAKVAPLKALSVPRLELMGALLGTRLAKAVIEYHSFPICRRVFWTDSKTTLAWIQSEHRRYRQFVAFRVGEILSKTDVIEWRYVPTLLNPADEATKWGKGPSTDVNSRWFCGPEFLYLPETEWPGQATTELETDEELRPCMVHREHQTEDVYEITRFSRWELLQRTAAYVQRFIGNCRRKMQNQPCATGCLKGEELRTAENSLWRTVQLSAYPDEIIALKQGEARPKKTIEKTSPIYKLTPYLDENGVMRVDSRIGAVPYVHFDFKYPIILPRRHYLTKLIVDWYHRSCSPSGKGLSDL
ncbi:uncharacterized protein LOC119768950 [Culex quinquefasciatus]|uniref:uncharacterized protein LOC119768950 n=1 Tax=Culex quinquefasciatus TaxID=7176 RepID=UPI0018E33C8C|nr:uncharacterized protein LOC119768950 [Culex quinquefasciatus]